MEQTAGWAECEKSLIFFLRFDKFRQDRVSILLRDDKQYVKINLYKR